MTANKLNRELERRVALLERPENQGQDYDGAAWFVLVALGIVLPVIALFLGRT